LAGIGWILVEAARFKLLKTKKLSIENCRLEETSFLDQQLCWETPAVGRDMMLDRSNNYAKLMRPGRAREECIEIFKLLRKLATKETRLGRTPTF
jgi:hypothetical protein